jgi:glycosyltransferase involved in cell wall biosynthesis
MSPSDHTPLRILHSVRAPVGGIIRHILDLANGQAARGHHVGILADSLTGGERAEAALAEIAPRMMLGIHRIAIRREPHPTDVFALRAFTKRVGALAPDVLHGHGAKAGAFVRLTRAAPRALRVYTPHGGSLHYSPSTPKGAFYAVLERALMNRTDLFLFESAFSRDTYQRVIGGPRNLVRCVHNGVTPEEFEPVPRDADATDLVFVGEFRHIKGADLMLSALAELRTSGMRLTLTLAGDGEETEALRELWTDLKLGDAARFIGHVPARRGFAKGRLLVVPSRGDSLPYVVIEAGAAGVPMIAARVGGIPEIFGEETGALFAPDDPSALARAIRQALADPAALEARAARLKERIAVHFSQAAMVEGVLAGYREAIARKR